MPIPGTVEVKLADPLEPLYVLHVLISLFRKMLNKTPKLDPRSHKLDPEITFLEKYFQKDFINIHAYFLAFSCFKYRDKNLR